MFLVNESQFCAMPVGIQSIQSIHLCVHFSTSTCTHASINTHRHTCDCCCTLLCFSSFEPCQLQLNTQISPAAEIRQRWRLGCTLYVMLVRSPPFHDDAQTRSGIELREQGKFYKTAAYEAFFGFSRCSHDMSCHLCAFTPDLVVLR